MSGDHGDDDEISKYKMYEANSSKSYRKLYVWHRAMSAMVNDQHKKVFLNAAMEVGTTMGQRLSMRIT